MSLVQVPVNLVFYILPLSSVPPTRINSRKMIPEVNPSFHRLLSNIFKL